MELYGEVTESVVAKGYGTKLISFHTAVNVHGVHAGEGTGSDHSKRSSVGRAISITQWHNDYTAEKAQEYGKHHPSSQRK